MKKILVPTDFSKPAEWSLEVASAIAKKTNSELILLHIIEQDTSESFNAEGQVETSELWENKIFLHKLIERRRNQLHEICQSLQDDGVTVRKELRLGNTFHGIDQTISNHQVDLIVMGTSGHSKFEEFLVGSNTEKVVRASRCPVLTIHQRCANLNFQNIVYATSLSENEESFSSVVKSVQTIFGTKVHLVRINTPMNFQPDHVVKKVLETFSHKNTLENCTLNIFNDYSEEEGIIHFADSIGADLIAMATHGRTGFARVLASSITEDVVNHAARPVLSYVIKQS